MRTANLLLLLLLLAGACATGGAPRPGFDAADAPAALPFIEDDYEGALALARARGVPLFVDAWAPWCHTCLSMKETVLRDPRLAPLRDRFVWLSIDTEKEQNAAFVAAHPQHVWPTLSVIDPADGGAVLRWLGSATADQLLALLEDGERAWRGGAEGANALLARADRLYAAGDPAGAAAILQEALARAPDDWDRRARAVESLLFAWSWGAAANHPACANLALVELERLPRSPSWANVAALGLHCALEEEALAPLRAPLEARAREALAPPPIEIAIDDRSSLYETIANARVAAGDEAGTKAIAAEWLAWLEEESGRAPTPRARAIHDYHLMRAAILLGEPERAVAPLRLSERQLPDDYNAPARLAMVYLEMGTLDEALAASDRALVRVYGPRKVRVLTERARILVARGDEAGAKRTLREAIRLAEDLPEAQRPHAAEAQARETLETLEARR